MQEYLLAFAESLTKTTLGQYRFRIGDYRVVFDLEDDEIIVITDVGHRKISTDKAGFLTKKLNRRVGRTVR